MSTPIAPLGYERFFILDSPLRIPQEHAAMALSESRRPEPAAAAQPAGLRLAHHTMEHRSRVAPPASASRHEPELDQPLFSESSGEIGGSAVEVAVRLSAGDWLRLDASAALRPREIANRYASATTVRGPTVSVTA